MFDQDNTKRTDFLALSLKYDCLKKHFNAQNKYDFSSIEAVRDLTKVILQDHYNLKIDLSDERLCPRVPNRVAYLEWIKTLIDETVCTTSSDELWNIDIGTGSSAIYPLLGHTIYGWNFVGTEVDDVSTKEAINNIRMNGLEDHIKVIKNDPSDPLLQVDKFKATVSKEAMKFLFSMCNPPFYSSIAELDERSKLKKTAKSTADLNAIPSELVTPGGEVEFVTRMIKESIHMEGQIKWYTSMLGMLESAYKVVSILKENEISNYKVGVIAPGWFGSTKRWIVAWSFGSERPIIPYYNNSLKKLNPKPTVNKVVGERTKSEIHDILKGLCGETSELKDGYTITTPGDIWSRAYRRSLKRKENEQSFKRLKTEKTRYVFGVLITKHEVNIIWNYGENFKVYESFCGFIRHELETKKY